VSNRFIGGSYQLSPLKNEYAAGNRFHVDFLSGFFAKKEKPPLRRLSLLN
jgi:hypothetical protein